MADSEGIGVRLRSLPHRTQIGFRVTPVSQLSAANALGIPALPGVNRFIGVGGSFVLWLGPDECLLIAPDGTVEWESRLRNAIGPDQGAVTDVSANRVGFELSGPAARDVLASCCALDLHPRVFGPGGCGQTLIAKAQVILAQTDLDTYRILVRPSFANYVAAWLEDGVLGVQGHAKLRSLRSFPDRL